jgi:hypothetical protein
MGFVRTPLHKKEVAGVDAESVRIADAGMLTMPDVHPETNVTMTTTPTAMSTWPGSMPTTHVTMTTKPTEPIGIQSNAAIVKQRDG